MQPMTHNPGAAGIGAQVVANGARGLADRHRRVRPR